MAFFRGLALMACMPFLSKGDVSPALRGGPAAEAVCTGDGKIKGNGPACYANSLASNSFSVKVISVEGDTGTVNLEATGSSFSAECEAQFQNVAGAITVEGGQQCDLGGYEYTVQYCSDQDQLIVHLIKPYTTSMVLPNTACPAGEI